MDLMGGLASVPVALKEDWGDLVDITEYLTDTPGFIATNGVGLISQIFDRDDGRQRPTYQTDADLKKIRAMCWLLFDRVPMAQEIGRAHV